MISGKVWGKTETILQSPFVEFHRAEIKAGSFCSRHMHRHKWNGFFVESGALKIKAWKTGYDLVDETILKAGDFTTIPPLEQHLFECLQDCVLFEIYWPEFGHDDIVRETVGGKA
jgi:mannose-6-phosphate isomerase-like protein (cupin superfamily)